MDTSQLNDVTHSKGRGRDKGREVEMEEEEMEEGEGDDSNSIKGSTTEGTTYLSAPYPYPPSSTTSLFSLLPFHLPPPSSIPLSLPYPLPYPFLYPFPSSFQSPFHPNTAHHIP